MAITTSTLPFRIVHSATICNKTVDLQANLLVNRLGALAVTGVTGVTARDRLLPQVGVNHPNPLEECFLVVTHGEFPVQFDTLTSYNAMALNSNATGLAGKLSTAVGNAPILLEGGDNAVLIAKAVSFDGIGYGLITLK